MITLARLLQPLSSRSAAAAGSAGRGLIYNLQSLRAAAALLVVLYHLKAWASIGDFHWAMGQAGVDIFFVLSGFMMGHVTEADPRVGRFLKRRIIRIVPLYWLLTLVLFAGALVAPSILSGGASPGLDELLLSLLFIPYAPPAGVSHSPLLFVGWTLNFEMFFYAVFALSMAVSHRLRIEIAAAAIAALVLAGWIFEPSTPALATYTDPMMLEFVGGLYLSRWFAGFRPEPDRRLAAAFGAGCVLILGLFVASEALIGDVPRLLLWGLPAFGLVLCALAAERMGAAVSATGPVLLGDASYAIYLLHPFVIGAMSAVIKREHGVFDPIFVAVALVCTICASIVLHLVVERRAIAWLNTRFGR